MFLLCRRECPGVCITLKVCEPNDIICLSVSFNLANSKKRSVTVKNVQSETSDENLKKLGEFVEKFIDGTKKETIKVILNVFFILYLLF